MYGGIDSLNVARVQPILYEKVTIRDAHTCALLLRTLRSNGSPACKKIRSMIFDCDKEADCVGRPILAEFAKDMTCLSVYGYAPIRSLSDSLNAPNLERLALIQKSSPPDPDKFGYASPMILSNSKWTHVLAVDDRYRLATTGLTLSQIVGILWTTARPIGMPPRDVLDNLTHVAVTTSATSFNIGHISLVSRVSPNLKYLALLETVEDSADAAIHDRFMSYIRTFVRQRFVVVIKDLGSPSMWGGEDAAQTEFWTKVENLVDEGYFSDQGDRWD